MCNSPEPYKRRAGTSPALPDDKPADEPAAPARDGSSAAFGVVERAPDGAAEQRAAEHAARGRGELAVALAELRAGEAAAGGADQAGDQLAAEAAARDLPRR